LSQNCRPVMLDDAADGRAVERIWDHFPEAYIPDGRPGRRHTRFRAERSLIKPTATFTVRTFASLHCSRGQGENEAIDTSNQDQKSFATIMAWFQPLREGERIGKPGVAVLQRALQKLGYEHGRHLEGKHLSCLEADYLLALRRLPPAGRLA